MAKKSEWTYDEYLAAKKEVERYEKHNGKDAIRETFAKVFAAIPELLSIRWTQYSPHFNDGDACEFSTNDMEFLFEEKEEDVKEVLANNAGTDEDEDEAPNQDDPAANDDAGTDEEDEDEDEEDGGYGSDEGPWMNSWNSAWDERKKALTGAQRKLLSQLETFHGNQYDLYEGAFGNGFMVVATRKGFKVEEYDHD